MSAGLDRETLEMIMEAFRDFAEEKLPEDLLLDLDHKDEFPHALVSEMCGAECAQRHVEMPSSDS